MKTVSLARAWGRPRKLSWRRLALVLPAVGLLLWVAWTLLWQVGFGLPGYADFYLHQSKYRNIIARIKAQSLKPGANIHEWVNGYSVEAERSPSGSYAITITTVDWHHAGVYGYVFSDMPLTIHPNDNYPDYPCIDNPGDMPFVDKGIVGQGGHWWSVYNSLD